MKVKYHDGHYVLLEKEGDYPLDVLEAAQQAAATLTRGKETSYRLQYPNDIHPRFYTLSQIVERWRKTLPQASSPEVRDGSHPTYPSLLKPAREGTSILPPGGRVATMEHQRWASSDRFEGSSIDPSDSDCTPEKAREFLEVINRRRRVRAVLAHWPQGRF